MEVSAVRISYSDKAKFYKELVSEAMGIAEAEWFVNLANFSALLNQHLPEINWVGFYLHHNGELLLSSFQGLPACTRIKMGKGVCGTAARSLQAQLVPDVDQFPGHIACDARSRSEVVIPLVIGGRLLGVLDVDAPVLNRFDEEDLVGLQDICKVLIEKTVWPNSFA
ncbi:GAF domain-containing protein [Bdellovibrio sp. SKB1291214]|uniref:GAF domain-containing protein n=1 Tax=Bdellovibrio sp. SKB1291214 TaxID=1732569 RepID=UPI000B515FC1|nr:GAF domain-containing protein [Bdellovibrio sp. SKB1291214]UYL09263.1 GAF domain-containing protein [Bdellovibrio sp. SKB1291214]